MNIITVTTKIKGQVATKALIAKPISPYGGLVDSDGNKVQTWRVEGEKMGRECLILKDDGEIIVYKKMFFGPCYNRKTRLYAGKVVERSAEKIVFLPMKMKSV